VFKKWHVDNKVLEKLFHERQEHHKSVTPKTALSNIIKVILTIGEILLK